MQIVPVRHNPARLKVIRPKTGPEPYFRGKEGDSRDRKRDALSLVASLLFLTGAGAMVVESRLENQPVPFSTWCWVGGCSLYTVVSAMPFLKRRKKQTDSSPDGNES